MRSGKGVLLEEANAMRIELDVHIPVPRVYGAETLNGISQSHYHGMHPGGGTLDEFWGGLSDTDKTDMIKQPRAILSKMRSIPPPGFIGSCAGREIRHTRYRLAHNAPACQNEDAFNSYLFIGCGEVRTASCGNALARRMRTDHRVVFSYCNLAPRNIIVD
ncbi:Choline/ethanolamine kinase [Geosmithia morbida]|uniref:Choline/ethanolamine kinase n=1 Tax=Geosmithia morbida TaxID=1094350 RepID=A0A9P5D1F1_9HYPO|nr:Choline/ethanolamine kinase [Geosmithia morbida]KAF4123828.1 Choline/ethanolamine kinase [Geosmithia morbida]